MISSHQSTTLGICMSPNTWCAAGVCVACLAPTGMWLLIEAYFLRWCFFSSELQTSDVACPTWKSARRSHFLFQILTSATDRLPLTWTLVQFHGNAVSWILSLSTLKSVVRETSQKINFDHSILLLASLGLILNCSLACNSKTSHFKFRIEFSTGLISVYLWFPRRWHMNIIFTLAKLPVFLNKSLTPT